MVKSRSDSWEGVYGLVRKIPAGKVMTYGQVALHLPPLSARAVGWALSQSPENVPWHRVVNASGGCSTDRLPHIPAGLQRRLLEREGVEFEKQGKIDLTKYRWLPDMDLRDH